ncbi:MAG: 50S ribosomal protein L29 [Patescibacteria group bacterium]|jgi:ribosomal protein L29
MKLEQLRKLSAADLAKEVDKTIALVAQLKSEIAMHRIKNWSRLREARQYLARIFTIIREKDIIKTLSNE